MARLIQLARPARTSRWLLLLPPAAGYPVAVMTGLRDSYPRRPYAPLYIPAAAVAAGGRCRRHMDTQRDVDLRLFLPLLLLQLNDFKTSSEEICRPSAEFTDWAADRRRPLFLSLSLSAAFSDDLPS